MSILSNFQFLLHFNSSTSFKANGAPKNRFYMSRLKQTSSLKSFPNERRRLPSILKSEGISNKDEPRVSPLLEQSESSRRKTSEPCLGSMAMTMMMARSRGEEVSRISTVESSISAMEPIEKNPKVVKLQIEPEFIADLSCPIPVNSETQTSIECRPFATVLRFRVVQIVCGIVTILLGVVAVLEPRTRATLGFGIGSGIVTTVASVNKIRETQQILVRRLSLTFPASLMNDDTLDSRASLLRLKLSPLYPFTSTFLCLFGALLILSLATASLDSGNHNAFVLGILLGISSILVLGIEFTVWIYSWKRLEKYTATLNEIALRNQRHRMEDILEEEEETGTQQ